MSKAESETMEEICFQSTKDTPRIHQIKLPQNLQDYVTSWGCSSVVERSLCMREVRGSKPRTSTFLNLFTKNRFLRIVKRLKE